MFIRWFSLGILTFFFIQHFCALFGTKLFLLFHFNFAVDFDIISPQIHRCANWQLWQGQSNASYASSVLTWYVANFAPVSMCDAILFSAWLPTPMSLISWPIGCIEAVNIKIIMQINWRVKRSTWLLANDKCAFQFYPTDRCPSYFFLPLQYA